jgi:S1-C subfamily serine protease
VPNAGFVPQMPAGVPQALPPSPAQPTEAEWQGLEVAPSPQGVLVAGAEGNAMRAGVLAGDLVASVNGASVASMADFVSATQNGLLAQGTIIVRRNGQRLAFELSSSPRNPAPPLATRPQTFQQQAGMAPAAMPYASPPVPQGGRF